MTFEEYWAKCPLKDMSPPVLTKAFKEIAQDVWEAGHDEGWESGYNEGTQVGYDEGSRNAD